MFKRSSLFCASSSFGGGGGRATGGNAPYRGPNAGGKRRPASVQKLPNMQQILRQGVGGGGASSQGQGISNSHSSRTPSFVDQQHHKVSIKKPGASSDLFYNQQRTTEVPLSSPAPPQGASGGGKQSVEAFSFRIGTRFAGFDAGAGASGGQHQPSTPPPSSSASYASRSCDSASASSAQIAEDEIEFDDSPPSHSPHTSSGRVKSGLSAAQRRSMAADEDDYDAYLDQDGDGDMDDNLGSSSAPHHAAGSIGKRQPNKPPSSSSAASSSRSYAEEGASEEGAAGDEDFFDPEAAAEAAAKQAARDAARQQKALKVRTLLLNKEIAKVAPKVRDWHALAAARKKTLVVQMDMEVEVKYSEIAPYLAPNTTVAADPRYAEKDARRLKTLSSSDLWACSKLLRSSRAARESQRTVVTGSKTAIRRIWKQYGIVPNVVYCPDDEPVPNWCLSSAAAAAGQRTPIIVRAPGAAINKDLLSAELNDGFAAEFTIDERSPIFRFGTSTFSGHSSTSAADADAATKAAAASSASTAGLDPALLFEDPKKTGVNLKASVFLTEARIPSNVGLAVKSAVENGYDSIILDRCVDLLNEKVIRASDGTIFHPKAKIFQLNESSGVSDPVHAAEIIQKACLRHNLLPLVTVPNQDAMPAFQMAQELFYGAEQYEAAQKQPKQQATAEGGAASSEATNSGTPNPNPNPNPSSSANDDDRTEDEKLNALALIRDRAANGGPMCAPPQGAMLLLGSEAGGLHKIIGAWHEGSYSESVPFRPVTLSMPDYRINSINVAVAGGILMKMFRPAAKKEHSQLFKLGVVPDGAEVVSMLPKANQPQREE